MERYAPTIKDLAPRDIVARAMANEVREGRGAGPNKDYVLLDLTHLEPAHIDAKLPDITEFARTYLGIEPYTEPVPVYPTAHYAMGGIPTTGEGEVLLNNEQTIGGLYAAGEVACVSVHGSNRLGTNSLLDINVFGKRAGKSAAQYSLTKEHLGLDADAAAAQVINQIENLKANPPGISVASLRKQLQEVMDANVQVFRSAETLHEALETIKTLKDQYKNVAIGDKGEVFNTDLVEAIELGFLLDLATVVTFGALDRKESRGGHYREDFPDRDDAGFMHHTMVYLRNIAPIDSAHLHQYSFADQHLLIGHKPVVQTRYEPMERKY